MQKPRKPGSQVPPNYKPNHTDRRTSSGHSKVPLAQATAGKLYRVRDKDWVAVWGEHLTWDEATKLKNSVVANGRSRTARVESMEVERPTEVSTEQPATRLLLDHMVTPEPETMEFAGVIRRLPTGYYPPGEGELVVNGCSVPVPTSVKVGDVVQLRRIDPALAATRSAALTAVRPIAQRAQRTRPVVRDLTASPPARPNPNPPRDQTVLKPSSRGASAPAGLPTPPASPLQVATMTDGPPLGDDALGDDDLADLVADIGGGPSDADLEHAERLRGDHERVG